MGNGICYKCRICGKKYEASWGIGMMFPEQYAKIMKKAKQGGFGEEYKKLINNNPNVAIDAEEYVYCCRSCKIWKVEPGLALYRPNSGCKTIIAQDYVTPDELKRHYRSWRHISHKCTKCGERMHRANEYEIKTLPCPYCGGPRDMDYEGLIMWD